MVSELAWSFHNPVRIRFGVGSLADLPDAWKHRHTLLVTTPGLSRRGLTQKVRSLLDANVITVLDNVRPCPDLAQLEEDSISLRGLPLDNIVAVGGGSVMDTAKVLSASLPIARGGPCLRTLLQSRGAEQIGNCLPVLAIPTTAGTGSEVTPFATVWDLENQRKLSLVSPHLYPSLALLDPRLTLSLPEEVTLSSGLDALSQGLESIWNRHANPISLVHAFKAVQLSISALEALKSDLSNLALRTEMMTASLLSGLAISASSTALAHSISYPVTARYGLPHGFACSFTLPAILEFNSAADDGRLLTLVRWLGIQSVEALIERLTNLVRRLCLPKWLAHYGCTAEGLIELAPCMITPGRADNNLRLATVQDVVAILNRTHALLSGVES